MGEARAKIDIQNNNNNDFYFRHLQPVILGNKMYLS